MSRLDKAEELASAVTATTSEEDVNKISSEVELLSAELKKQKGRRDYDKQ